MGKSYRKFLFGCAAAVALTACSSPEQKVARYYESGQEFLANEDLARAKIQFRNALKIDEQHVPSLEGMVDIAEAESDFQNVFAITQRIARLEPENVGALVTLGKIFLISSDETQAIEKADEALALEPNNDDAIALKAAVKIRLGDTQDAVALATIVNDRNPAHVEAATVLATERTMDRDFTGALEYVDAALEVEPRIAVLQLLKIRLLSLLERPDDVIATYRGLMNAFPERAVYRKAYTIELIGREDFDEALIELRKIAELEPDSLDAKLDVVRLVNKNEGREAAERELRQFADAEPGNLDLQYAVVDYLIQNDRRQEAKDILAALMQSDVQSDALRAKNRLIAILLAEGSLDEAKAKIDEVLEEDDNNTDALMRRAGLHITNAEYDSAILDLRTALNNEPNSPQLLTLMGGAFEGQGSVSLARAEYQKAFNVEGSSARVANAFAKFLLRQNDLAAAESVLTESIATYPTSRENLRLLANVRLSSGDWQGADEIAAILENVQPDENADLVRNIRSVSLLGLEDFDGVAEILSPENSNKPLDSQPLAVLTTAYIRSGETDKAEELLNGVISSGDNVYLGRLLLAQVLSSKGDIEGTVSMLETARKEFPERAQAYEHLYRYYLASNQSDKAFELIDDGLAVNADNSALQYFKADAYLTQGNLDDALNLYSKLIASRPNDKIVANNFVSLTSDLKTDAASLNRALEVSKILENDNNPAFRDTVGWINFRTGEYDRAVQFLNQAAAQISGNAEVLYHLGEALVANGDVENGRARLEEALELGGADFKYAPRIKEILK